MRSDTSKKDEILLPTSVVSQRITSARLQKGYKQIFMANQLGITERAYQNIESNANKDISIGRLQEIAGILGVECLNLVKPEDKISQILNAGDHSPSSNNIYNSDKDLIHQIEKLKMQLEFAEKEKSGLARELAQAQEIILFLKGQK